MRSILSRGLVFYSFAAILLLGSYPGDQNCTRFHNGYFYQPLQNGDSVFIERDDSTQLDIYHNGNAIRATIKWLNDCEYELSLTGLLENGRDVPVPDNLKGATNRVKITATGDRFYAFEAKRSDGVRFSDTMWVGRKTAGAKQQLKFQ